MELSIWKVNSTAAASVSNKLSNLMAKKKQKTNCQILKVFSHKKLTNHKEIANQEETELQLTLEGFQNVNL